MIEKSSDPSFPSDHATVGVAIAVFLILAQDRWRIWFTIMSVLLCLSRVSLGTHYMTDVVGGAIIGAVATFIIVFGRDPFE